MAKGRESLWQHPRTQVLAESGPFISGIANTRSSPFMSLLTLNYRQYSRQTTSNGALRLRSARLLLLKPNSVTKYKKPHLHNVRGPVTSNSSHCEHHSNQKKPDCLRYSSVVPTTQAILNYQPTEESIKLGQDSGSPQRSELVQNLRSLRFRHR